MKKLTYSQYIEKGYGYVADRQLQTASTPLHNHDFFEIEFIVDSLKSFHILNGKKRSLHKGSIYIINPSDVHTHEIVPGGYFDRYNIRFKQDIIKRSMFVN